MKKFLCASIFIPAFCAASFAQNNQSASCPVLSVSGPNGIPQAGETIPFTANIDRTGFKNVIYNWTVSKGEIIEGQGTTSIRVKLPVKLDGVLTATVEVQGLPQNCPNKFSETLSRDLPPKAEKIDEFSGSISKIEKPRTDAIVKAIQDDPNAQLYILVGYKEKTSPQTKNKREKEISNVLVKENGIQADRITIIRVPADKDLTKIWLVPAGATPPYLEA